MFEQEKAPVASRREGDGGDLTTDTIPTSSQSSRLKRRCPVVRVASLKRTPKRDLGKERMGSIAS